MIFPVGRGPDFVLFSNIFNMPPMRSSLISDKVTEHGAGKDVHAFLLQTKLAHHCT